MDTEALQIFVEVMRRGSFARVARDRDTDPSSISRTIAGLEEELGMLLFQRSTRRLAPTEAGVAYFERVEPLLLEMEDARETATGIAGEPSGILRVTASVSFGHQCILPWLPGFMSTYPKIVVELILADTIVDLLTERIDLAIRLGTAATVGPSAHHLLNVRYHVCASPKYLRSHGPVLKPADIRDSECLLFPLPGFRPRWLFRGSKGEVTDIPVKARMLSSGGIALRECALAGMGLALLPSWLVGADLRKETLVDVFPEYEVTPTDFDTAAWLMFPSSKRMPGKARVFVDYLKKELKDNPPWMR